MSTGAPIAKLLPGMHVYKYSLKHRIGIGSFGEVWLAADNAVGQDYAIKILLPGIPVNDRLREAHIGHSLTHNNLVRVHQADVVNIGGHDLVIIAMDYLSQGSITKLANPSGYIPMPEVIRIGIDILRGLEYLHSHNFFHNDVKPENVLLGPGNQGMLSDYGIVGISTDGSPLNPNVAERYMSALEMRRDLEKLNYPGHWTIAPSGAFIGRSLDHEFRFEHHKAKGGKYDVAAFKKSKATQRETRIGKHCLNGVTNHQSAKQIERFVKAVVEGI